MFMPNSYNRFIKRVINLEEKSRSVDFLSKRSMEGISATPLCFFTPVACLVISHYSLQNVSILTSYLSVVLLRYWKKLKISSVFFFHSSPYSFHALQKKTEYNIINKLFFSGTHKINLQRFFFSPKKQPVFKFGKLCLP